MLGGAIAGVARVILEVDNRKLKPGLDKGERDVKGFATRGASALGTFAKTFASIGAVGGVAGLAALFKSSISAASDLNEELSKSRQIFGENAGEVEAWSKTSSEAMKVAQVEALGYSGAIGNMLKTVGVAGPRLSEMSRDIVQLGADMASFNNEDPSEMLERLRSGLAGEAEPLRRFGVLLSEAAVQEEAVRIGLVRQGEALTEQEKVLARYSLIMRQTADQQGDVARTGGELAGQQRELRARVIELQAALGQQLLPVQLAVIKQLSEWATALSENKQLQQDVKDAVREAVDAISATVDVVDDVADALGGWESAAQFIIAGTLVAKLATLRRAFTLLAGAEAAAAGGAAAGTGIAGAAGAAAVLRNRLILLSRMGAIGITVAVAMKIKGDKSLWEFIKEETGLDLAQQAFDAVTGGGEGVAPGSKQAGVVATAKRLGPGSGITYTWGGMTPQRGFDCSGYLVYVYLQHGIKIPRDTRGQWNDPNAIHVAPGHERPGDGVYFVGSRSGRNAGPPPGHVGIYIGGGKFIEYFSQGKPAKISNLAGRGDYMGARRWLKIEVDSATGGRPEEGRGARDAAAGATKPDDTTGDTPTTKPLIPLRLQERLARAEVTKGTKDDLAVLREIEDYLEKRILAEKKVAERVKLLRELKSVRSQIADITGGRSARASAALIELVPPVLENRLARAELTKTLADDLDALTAIEAYLEKRLAKEEKITEQTKILRELKRVREQIAGIRAGQSAGGLGKTETSFAEEVDRLVGLDPRDQRPARMFAPGTNFVEQITTAEGKSALGKLLASLEPEKASIRAWAKALDAKKKAAIEKRDAAAEALKKYLKTPRKLRDPGVEAQLRAKVKHYNDQAQELQEAIDRAFEMWGELEAAETSEVQRLAEEDEQRRSEAPPHGGGIGGFDMPADSSPEGPAPFSPQQVAAMRAEFLGARSRFFNEFSSNVFTRGPFGLELGSDALGGLASGGRVVNVNMNFNTPPGDLHAYFDHAQFAAEHALG